MVVKRTIESLDVNVVAVKYFMQGNIFAALGILRQIQRIINAVEAFLSRFPLRFGSKILFVDFCRFLLICIFVTVAKVCCGGIPAEKNAGKKCCNVRGEVNWYDPWEEVCLSNGVRKMKSRTEQQCGTRDTFDPAEQPKAECCRGRKFDIVCKFS